MSPRQDYYNEEKIGNHFFRYLRDGGTHPDLPDEFEHHKRVMFRQMWGLPAEASLSINLRISPTGPSYSSYNENVSESPLSRHPGVEFENGTSDAGYYDTFLVIYKGQFRDLQNIQVGGQAPDWYTNQEPTLITGNFNFARPVKYSHASYENAEIQDFIDHPDFLVVDVTGRLLQEDSHFSGDGVHGRDTTSYNAEVIIDIDSNMVVSAARTYADQQPAPLTYDPAGGSNTAPVITLNPGGTNNGTSEIYLDKDPDGSGGLRTLWSQDYTDENGTTYTARDPGFTATDHQGVDVSDFVIKTHEWYFEEREGSGISEYYYDGAFPVWYPLGPKDYHAPRTNRVGSYKVHYHLQVPGSPRAQTVTRIVHVVDPNGGE